MQDKFKIKNYYLGFTLIEIVVVVSVLAVVMVTISSALTNSFKARSRVDLADTLEQNGSYILREITNNFLNSDARNVVCTVPGQITLTSEKDGGQTIYSCVDNGDIASNSAKLTQGLTAGNCAQFISCETDAGGNVTAIDVGFTLTAGVSEAGPENYGSRSFQTKVVVRN